MADYKKMYLYLFNKITDALGKEDLQEIKEILMEAQIYTEEMYISFDE